MATPRRNLETADPLPQTVVPHETVGAAPRLRGLNQLDSFRSDKHSFPEQVLEPVEQAQSGNEDAELQARIDAQLEKLRRSARALRNYSEDLAQRSDASAAANKRKPLESARPEQIKGNYRQLRGKGMIESVVGFGFQILKQPGTFSKHYLDFAGEVLRILKSESELAPERGDRRFRDAVWQDNPVYRMVLQAYLAWDKEVRALIDDLELEDEQDRARAEFIFDQLSAALAPSNSPLNPVAVKRAYQTGGRSVLHGLQNLLRDLSQNHGMPRQISADAYQLGKDLGCSPGAVVHRSPLFELIQYTCDAKSLVHQRPVLIVPPQINKFYVFDLSPKNSVVQHLLQQGLQVFIVSWKNPNRAHANAGLSNYLDELDKGVQAVLDISGSDDLNLVSACAGGATAVSLQARYAKQGRQVVRNHSLLVTALSVAGHPTLDLFVNKNSIAASLARSQRRGVMEGKELAHVFAWLRPTDLVWNFWINNNLLGKEPPTMDVLHWDNDSTRLPAALHRDFADLFLNDRFADNKVPLGGDMLSLDKIRGDFYFLAGDEDYLMPWRNCYRNSELFAQANCRFVLSNSGHIQSVLRPPGIASSCYYRNDEHPDCPQQWLADAERHQGSWWEDWSEWFSTRSGELKPAPKRLGNENYPPLCPSPGTYVLER